MIIDATSAPEGFEGGDWETADTERFFAAWKGTLYVSGSGVGKPSVTNLLRSLVSEPLVLGRRHLHGVFVLAVFDKLLRRWSVTVDNAGLYQAFYDEDTVATSLLEMVSRKGSGAIRIPILTAVEFLAHRGVHWRRTLVEGVRVLDRDEVIELDATGHRLMVVKDEAVSLEPLPVHAFTDLIANLARALQDVSVSVDLSGGFDSRLLACLLRHRGVEFEAAISGRQGLLDVVIGGEAAERLGCPFFVTTHDIDDLEDALGGLFLLRDGLGDILEYHRPAQMQAARVRRGIQVAISGVGGEVLKDFWWLHDFPRYRRHSVNLARFYDLRMAGAKLPSGLLSDEATDAHRQLRSETIVRFGNLVGLTNTETYDRIYYLYRMPVVAGGFLTNHVNNFLPVLAPFLDPVSFRVGYGLPRRKRTFNAFHRNLLSKECPALAGLRTDSGGTARAGVLSVTSEAAALAVSLSKKAVDKASQRTLGRSVFWHDPDAPGLKHRIRASSEFVLSLDALKKQGVLRAGVCADHVPPQFVGRLLTLGMFVRYAEGELSAARAPVARRP